MFPLPNIEFTDHVLQFGMNETICWILFRTKPATYRITRDNKHFSAIVERLTQAKEQGQPVHVRIQNTQILDLDLSEEIS
jgi:hypothetical protein